MGVAVLDGRCECAMHDGIHTSTLGGGTERQVEAGTRGGGGRPGESIFALGAMTQLMRSYRGASIAG
ncbi:hypothetical protein SORBI_3010G041301 [Sorghum bicolor]|uniref:Uncharacterized protein n=1 Tax=Sorghum bicolor TaxID=4558 RepID=A0A1W0VRC3_SORBI|nr:hypothetical protein SORBI_3010G041301 [Sorghum bicolor]